MGNGCGERTENFGEKMGKLDIYRTVPSTTDLQSVFLFIYSLPKLLWAGSQLGWWRGWGKSCLDLRFIITFMRPGWVYADFCSLLCLYALAGRMQTSDRKWGANVRFSKAYLDFFVAPELCGGQVLCCCSTLPLYSCALWYCEFVKNYWCQ